MCKLCLFVLLEHIGEETMDNQPSAAELTMYKLQRVCTQSTSFELEPRVETDFGMENLPVCSEITKMR